VVGIFTEKFHGQRFALHPGMKMTIKARAFSRKKFHEQFLLSTRA
jgi:hypothetical protein